MKLYKIRMNCLSFQDIVVKADSEEEAKIEAGNLCQCPQNGMEFGEFLPVEKDDEPENYPPPEITLTSNK
jgi:hypothetical protein